MSPYVRKMNSQKVSVKALQTVVIITVPAVNMPSCPIFLAIIYELTVVAEPSITKAAVNLLCTKPKCMAMGKNKAQKTNSFITLQIRIGLMLLFIALNFSAPPIAIRPNGVAKAATPLKVLCIIIGIGIFSNDHIQPAAIPKMMGFFNILSTSGVIPVILFLQYFGKFLPKN